MKSKDIYDQLSTYHAVIIATLPRILTGIVVFFLFWLAAIIAKAIIIRLANHSKSRKYLLRLLGQTAKISIIIVGLISALGTMGINVTAMVTSLGLVGFALGFALKDFLSNIIAGFMILFYHPFQVDDTISIGDTSGIVAEINLRYTIIRGEAQTFLIPNSSLITSTIKLQQIT